eukprot:15660_5
MKSVLSCVPCRSFPSHLPPAYASSAPRTQRAAGTQLPSPSATTCAPDSGASPSRHAPSQRWRGLSRASLV